MKRCRRLRSPGRSPSPEDGFHLPDFLSTTLPAPDPDWGARAAPQARGLALGRSSDGVLGSLLATNRDSLSEATLPIPLVMPDPIYPPALRAAGIEGRVVIEFVVDGSGRPDSGSIQVLSTDLPPFGEAARQSVLGSRFRPGRSNGRPVAVRVRQVVRFLVK